MVCHLSDVVGGRVFALAQSPSARILLTNLDAQVVGRRLASPYRVSAKLGQGLNLGIELINITPRQRMPLDRPYERPSSIRS